MSTTAQKTRCPLCGSDMTQFLHPYCDSGLRLPPEDQRCSAKPCGLPVRLWAVVADVLSAAESILNRKWYDEASEHACVSHGEIETLRAALAAARPNA